MQITGNGVPIPLDRSDIRSKQGSALGALGFQRTGGSQAPSHGARSAISQTQSRYSQVSKGKRLQSDDDDEEEEEEEDVAFNDNMKQLTLNNKPSHDVITEIDLTRTPRSTYTAFTTTPSVLAGEVVASHFHDEELCILLHAADNEATHDVVKKVLRKGVRERVKKLGLDHQREVRDLPIGSCQSVDDRSRLQSWRLRGNTIRKAFIDIVLSKLSVTIPTR
jgi:hypothetical protein